MTPSELDKLLEVMARHGATHVAFGDVAIDRPLQGETSAAKDTALSPEEKYARFASMTLEAQEAELRRMRGGAL